MGGGGGNSELFLLPASSGPHGLALTPWLLPVHPWSFSPPGGRGCVPQTAAPAGDAAGRTGRDTRVFRLLWKEAEGREGGSWVPRAPSLGPGLQPMDPADMWAVEQSAQTHSFGCVF